MEIAWHTKWHLLIKTRAKVVLQLSKHPVMKHSEISEASMHEVGEWQIYSIDKGKVYTPHASSTTHMRIIAKYLIWFRQTVAWPESLLFLRKCGEPYLISSQVNTVKSNSFFNWVLPKPVEEEKLRARSYSLIGLIDANEATFNCPIAWSIFKWSCHKTGVMHLTVIYSKKKR